MLLIKNYRIKHLPDIILDNYINKRLIKNNKNIS